MGPVKRVSLLVPTLGQSRVFSVSQLELVQNSEIHGITRKLTSFAKMSNKLCEQGIWVGRLTILTKLVILVITQHGHFWSLSGFKGALL